MGKPSKVLIIRGCAVCGKALVAYRSTRKTCSPSCRNKRSRAKRKELAR